MLGWCESLVPVEWCWIKSLNHIQSISYSFILFLPVHCMPDSGDSSMVILGRPFGTSSFANGKARWSFTVGSKEDQRRQMSYSFALRKAELGERSGANYQDRHHSRVEFGNWCEPWWEMMPVMRRIHLKVIEILHRSGRPQPSWIT